LSGLGIEEAMARYLAELLASGKFRRQRSISEKTRDQMACTGLLFGKIYPGPIGDFQQIDLEKICQALDRLPVSWGESKYKRAEFNRLSFDEFIDLERVGACHDSRKVRSLSVYLLEQPIGI
jgi:hypothetical protein